MRQGTPLTGAAFRLMGGNLPFFMRQQQIANLGANGATGAGPVLPPMGYGQPLPQPAQTQAPQPPMQQMMAGIDEAEIMRRPAELQQMMGR